MESPPTDFESAASASSAIPALGTATKSVEYQYRTASTSLQIEVHKSYRMAAISTELGRI